jgi:hypothetical protein
LIKKENTDVGGILSQGNIVSQGFRGKMVVRSKDSKSRLMDYKLCFVS